MSLYQDYCNERKHCSIIEYEWGFSTYGFTDKETIYLMDMYIKPEERKGIKSVRLLQEVEEAGILNGCLRIITTVSTNTIGSSYSLLCCLKYGFKITGNDGSMLYLSKEF